MDAYELTTLRWEIRDLKRERDTLRARLEEMDDILGRLVEWTHEYGKSLCPTGADTYGEGVRACKRQVANIIGARGTPEPEDQST